MLPADGRGVLSDDQRRLIVMQLAAALAAAWRAQHTEPTEPPSRPEFQPTGEGGRAS